MEKSRSLDLVILLHKYLNLRSSYSVVQLEIPEGISSLETLMDLI